jgi:predicted amidophosphoribosyltransferase
MVEKLTCSICGSTWLTLSATYCPHCRMKLNEIADAARLEEE